MPKHLGVLALAGMFVAASTAAVGADPSWYVKKGTWQDTFQAAHEAKAKAEADEAARAPAPAPTPAVGGVKLGPWYQAGPFVPKEGRGFAYVFPPEQGVDVTKPCGGMNWARKDYPDGVVHMLQAPGNGSTYLYRTITVEVPRTLTGYFGSDDGLVAWLNGKKLVSNDVPRGPAPNQDTAKLELQKGENALLLKIYNISGGHGFYFSTSPTPVGGTGLAAKADPDQPIWDLVARDFPDAALQREMRWEREDQVWSAEWKAGDFAALAQRYGAAARGAQAGKVKERAAGAKDAAALAEVRTLYHQAREADEAASLAAGFNFEALRLAIDDLMATYGDKYPNGKPFMARLESLQKAIVDAAAAKAKGDAAAQEKLTAAGKDLVALRSEALLANPLLKFETLLCVKRNPKKLGLPQNWQGNSSVGPTGYDNEIDTLSVSKGELKTLYRPAKDGFVGDLELHFDGDRFLFSMPGTHGRFQIFEMKVDGTGLRQVTPGDQPDVDNYSATYLPDGRIMFCSTACYLGVPCVGGGDAVGSLYLMDEQAKSIRQLTFDQDHSWYPHVLNNGRIIYTRWEYSDIPHYFSRLLFEMNPDGTAQFEYYGSNSYWPNSTFYARPIPGHPSKVVAVISGHHGVPRMGELILFDPARGRHESSGVVQRIPGYGKEVKPTIADGLVDGSWPKFLHPFPLSDKYFIVACQPQGNKPWGIYLVDSFDNLLPLREEAGYALLEPIPVEKTNRPPVIPDRAKPDQKTATVYLVDVYRGKGLRGVPRGTVKALRVYTNRYGFRGMGGHYEIGIDGPWDAKRILGTVPVNEDGSALFKVPANLPIVVEPLDAEGKALQVMRSWYTAMPGEFASCVGCHEPQSASPGSRQTMATGKEPTEIQPWFGPARPFSFEREVQQPVLQRYCVGCHSGQARPDGKAIPDFRAKGEVASYRGRFTPAYDALHRYVRRPGPESDYHLPMTCEYEANTSELIQMLKKGHHNVKLDTEAWQRLYAWIDLNVPCHGTWTDRTGGGAIKANQRMMELAKLYGGYDVNTEVYPDMPKVEVATITPEPESPVADQKVDCPNWPLDAAEAKKRQQADGPAERSIDLAPGLKLELVRIPAGEFVMGSLAGAVDERPLARVRIEKPFWMGKLEITNAEYALFDATHDSGIISMHNKDQSQRGYPVNNPKQPVVRIAWREAMAFTSWLSKLTGEKFTLPTEAQWEYACRAGAGTPLSFGDLDTDFSTFANLGDKMLRSLAVQGFPPRVVENADPVLDWVPKDDRFYDKNLVTADVGSFKPNAWGLADMHGNAAEWTRTSYKPYPYNAADGRDSVTPEGGKVARGGSWFDRPKRCTSSFRLAYPAWQGVYNVGFRVISESDPKATPVVRAK